jgi:hypothetical protein
MTKDNNEAIELNPSGDDNDIKGIANWVKTVLLKTTYFEVRGDSDKAVLLQAIKGKGIDVTLVPIAQPNEDENGSKVINCRLKKMALPPPPEKVVEQVDKVVEQVDESVSFAALSESSGMSASQIKNRNRNKISLAASTNEDDNVFIIEGITGFSVVRVCTERLVEDPDKKDETFPMLISHEFQEMEGGVRFSISSRASEALEEALESKLFLILLPTAK